MTTIKLHTSSCLIPMSTDHIATYKSENFTFLIAFCAIYGALSECRVFDQLTGGSCDTAAGPCGDRDKVAEPRALGNVARGTEVSPPGSAKMGGSEASSNLGKLKRVILAGLRLGKGSLFLF